MLLKKPTRNHFPKTEKKNDQGPHFKNQEIEKHFNKV